MNLMKLLSIAAIFGFATLSYGLNIIENGDFSQGMKGWWSYPKRAKTVKIVDVHNKQGKVLLVAPEATNIGVNSYQLPVGAKLDPAKTYNVSFTLKVESIKQGVAAVSLIFFRQNRKVAKQLFLHKIVPGNKSDWQHYSYRVGAGTKFPFPPHAAYAVLRISFWAANGKCDGRVMVDDIQLSEAKPSHLTAAVTDTDVGFIKSRHEQQGSNNFYWIEAENMVPKAAYIGSLKYRNTWNYRRTGLPNDSMNHSLVRPLTKTVTSATAAIKCQPGKYNLWIRIGTFRPWKSATVTLKIAGRTYDIAPQPTDSKLERAFSWIKVTQSPLQLGKEFRWSIINSPNPERMKVVDCLLLTNNLQYLPPKQLPAWGYFSALPYKGPKLEADFWVQRQLNTPLYICRDSAQQFLIRLRNYAGQPLTNFDLELTLPAGITLIDPSRKLRWSGALGKWENPHFIADSPTAIERRIVAINGKKYNRYNLIYTKPIKPYNLAAKVSSLTFITLQAAKTIRPGHYEVTLKPFASSGDWTGMVIKQPIEILPPLQGMTSSRYNWGVDGIYASFLSPAEQNALLKSFSDAGINLWASRVRAANPALSRRNQQLWQRVRKADKMNLVCWSEWFWPGTPYTDESLKYCQKYPEALGVWRNDDRGKSLAGKLICPSYLLSAESSYLQEHMTKICQLLKANGISEYLEDVEYSSPLSYCFCERCKQQFSQFSKLPYSKLKALDGDQIIRQYRKQWVAFRIHQNTRLVDKISTLAVKLYPQIKFKLFCGYQSWGVKNRYGVDWEQLLKLPHVAGAYIGGGMPGTAEQINQAMQWSKKNHKEFLSMGNATLSFPHGYDEMGTRNQAYLEARIIHDIMCGSGGLFIWWWGTLDGRCLKAFETGSKLAAKYGDIMLEGKHEYRQVGITKDFSLLTSSNKRGILICLANPSRYTEDRILNPAEILKLFPKNRRVLNLLSGKYETPKQLTEQVKKIYRKGDVSLWFIPAGSPPVINSSVAKWPKDIVADVGDLEVRFESRSFWTLYRIDYQGSRLGLDQFGSHYGHVAKYPGVGFIGSGHTENDKEQVVNLKLYINGLAISKPVVKYKCNSIKLVKKSKIGNLVLDSEISVKNGRIIEELKIGAEKPEKLDFMYLFMHPWVTSFSDFAVLDKAHEMSGKFTDSKRFMVNKPLHAVTLFNSKLKRGILTVITAVPYDIKWLNLYWDVPGRYRKHYLKTFINQTISPGKSYYFKAVTIPFACNRKDWLKRANELYKKVIK